MKTIIHEDNKSQKQLIISDDYFSVPGWVTLIIGDESIELHLNDLMPSIIGFDAKYSREKEQE